MMFDPRLIAYAAIAGALLLVGWQWHARGQRIDALLKVSGEITAERDQCQTAQKAIDDELATLRAAGEADRAKRAEAERKAAQVSADAERRIRTALVARVPSECPAAMDWLGAYGRDLSTRWEPAR